MKTNDKIALKIENLTKEYKKENKVILKDINLEIENGMSTAIMGYSGSGKTTLLNCISGIDLNYEGSVYLNGENIAQMKENKLIKYRRKYTSFIFQQYNLVDVLNVYDNILLPYKLAKEKIEKNKLAFLINKLGLTGKENMLPKKLSGGEQQRVCIARALLGKNRIIFADEPTGALDVNTAKEVLKLLLDCAKEFNLPVVIITHDSNVAAACNTIHFINNGKIETTLLNSNTTEINKIMEGLKKNV